MNPCIIITIMEIKRIVKTPKVGDTMEAEDGRVLKWCKPFDDVEWGWYQEAGFNKEGKMTSGFEGLSKEQVKKEEQEARELQKAWDNFMELLDDIQREQDTTEEQREQDNKITVA
jgi:hypothetical protein